MQQRDGHDVGREQGTIELMGLKLQSSARYKGEKDENGENGENGENRVQRLLEKFVRWRE